MNRFHQLHRLIAWVPMPGVFRFAWRRAVYDRQYAAEKQATELLDDPDKISDFHGGWHFEFHMLDDEEREYYSKKLLEGGVLRCPGPRATGRRSIGIAVEHTTNHAASRSNVHPDAQPILRSSKIPPWGSVLAPRCRSASCWPNLKRAGG
jgi:hypothetical protein